MKVKDLLKLNLDDLETELEKGSFSKEFLDSALKAENADKTPRKGAIELLEAAIGALGEDDTTTATTTATGEYVVADSVRSLSFTFAGIKVSGDVVDPSWADFKQNDKLLASLLERGLVVAK